MRNIRRKLLYISFLLLIIECGLRGFYAQTHNIPFSKPDLLFLRYYPELRELVEAADNKQADEESLLVLGGSVVSFMYCDMDTVLNYHLDSIRKRDIRVYSFAKPAQTSLDSWTKYRLLKDYSFDWVLFYHGINDTRSNNCPKEVFDLDYRHVGFYNEVYTLMRHPEMRFTVIPYSIDYIWQRIRVMAGWKQEIPKEYNVMEYFHEKKAPNRLWWEHGKDIKTRESFERNLRNIIELAKEKGEQLILSTYAHHQPDEYTLEKFVNKELGYVDHSWPTELYGEPAYIKQGIIAHNTVIREVQAEYPDLHFIEFQQQLPQEGQYFFDICHLTPPACDKLGKEILTIMDNLQSQNP